MGWIIYYFVITDTNKKVLVSSFDSEKRLSDQPLSTWSQGRIELTQNVIISNKDQSYGIQKMVGRLRSVRTGTLTPQLESMIRKLGGTIANNISGSVDYLILGSSPGSKLTKAEELSIKVLTEAEFMDMLSKP